MTTPEQRIAKMRAQRCLSWISDEQFTCPGCGEGFRYKLNLAEHIKRCLDYKFKGEKE